MREETAFDVPESELDAHFATAYGIFGGKADKVAVLRFTPSAPAGPRMSIGIPEKVGSMAA